MKRLLFWLLPNKEMLHWNEYDIAIAELEAALKEVRMSRDDNGIMWAAGLHARELKVGVKMTNIPINFRVTRVFYSTILSDIEVLHRSLKERLFILPWHPFQRDIYIHKPYMTIINGDLYAHPSFKVEIERLGGQG